MFTISKKSNQVELSIISMEMLSKRLMTNHALNSTSWFKFENIFFLQ